MEIKREEEDYQYYTIGNEAECSNDFQDDYNEQIVFLTIDTDKNLEYNNLNQVEDNVEPGLEVRGGTSCFKVITLNNSSLLLKSQDENFESIEPHLITSEINEHDEDVSHEDSTLNAEGVNFEFMEIVENDPQILQLIYCDDSSQSVTELSDNDKASVCSIDNCDHQDCGNRRYICALDDCPASFSSMSRLEAHIASHYIIFNDADIEEETQSGAHKIVYVCSEVGCNCTFSNQHDWKTHKNAHKGRPYSVVRMTDNNNKRFVCNTEGCRKAFSSNFSLKAHVRTHTGERPYACGLCGKCFNASGDLQKHVRIHTGEKPFVCPIEGCGKSFTTSNIRKVHIRSHTGERPYTCSFSNCGKAFASSTNYKNHLRIHSGEKPYECKVKGCGKRFTEYSSLYKHNLVHQSGRPLSCNLCPQKFKQTSSLNIHRRFKHNIIFSKDGTEVMVKVI